MNRIIAAVILSTILTFWGCATPPTDWIPSVTGIEKDIAHQDERGPLQQHTKSKIRSDMHPTISRDGRFIFFASAYPGAKPELYRKPIHGSKITQLTQCASDDIYPCPSPDGKILAFVSNRSGHHDIYIMPIPLGSAKPRQIIPGSRTSKLHPSFSPDGKRLVYSELNSATHQWELAIYDIENNSVSYPRPGLNAMFPEWCPVAGSEQIAFQHVPRGGPGLYTLRLINTDGTSFMMLRESDDYACINPSWSPDGKFIVYATSGKSPRRLKEFDEADNIWVVNVTTTADTQVTFHGAEDWNPAFAPGGRRVFFSSRRGGGKNIWSIPFRP